MKSVGRFRFKGLEKRSGGSFTNERGQLINYSESYVLKLDEETELGIYERKLKFSADNSTLLGKVQNLAPYSKIDVTCDISFFGNNVKVTPIDIIEAK